MAQKPVNVIRNGAVKASIWKNETEKGVFYNTTITKLYRKGKDWKTSNSFSRDQLLVVARLAQEANAWIYDDTNKDAGKPQQVEVEPNSAAA